MRTPAPTFTLLVLLLASHPAAGEAGPPATWQEAVAFLEDATSVDTEHTGFAGSRSTTWKAYEVLRAVAPLNQLQALTDHRDPVVRTYAVWALAEHHPGTDLVRVLSAHLDDSEQVPFMQGCVMMDDRVGDIMLSGVIRHLAEPELLALTARHLWRGGEIPVLDRLLHSGPFGQQALPELRELAADGNGDALIVIARHTRQEDVPLLLQALDVEASGMMEIQAPLRAVTLFPDDAFRHRLAELARLASADAGQGEEVEPAWYAAVAAWRDDDASTLLRRVLDSAATEQQEAVGKAILAAIGRQEDCRSYDELRWVLWVEHNLTDRAALHRLKAVRRGATRTRVKEILRTRAGALPPDLLHLLRTLFDD